MKNRFILCVVLLNLVTAISAQNPQAVLIADSLQQVSLFDSDGWGGTPQAWTLQEHLDGVASNDDLVALSQRSRPCRGFQTAGGSL